MNISDWFNSNYYHVLYSNRNDAEAEAFLTNLLMRLKPKQKAFAWDLCCGNGRHSAVLHRKGLLVTGTDASENNIKMATARDLPNAEFYVHDMRNVFRINAFDYVFNLFTSFGYFENKREDEKVLRSVYAALKPEGVFILDYLNPNCVINHLVNKESIEKENYVFEIERLFDGTFIRKKIKVTDGINKYEFEEAVRAYTPLELEKMAQTAGFKTLDTFGNYQLETLQENSPRSILIFQK